jgi:hypothetical protein
MTIPSLVVAERFHRLLVRCLRRFQYRNALA